MAIYNFIKQTLSPGEIASDNHHLGVQVRNNGPAATRIRLTIYTLDQKYNVTLEIPIAPESFITQANEQSAMPITIENLGQQNLIVEWKKSRD